MKGALVYRMWKCQEVKTVLLKESDFVPGDQ